MQIETQINIWKWFFLSNELYLYSPTNIFIGKWNDTIKQELLSMKPETQLTKLLNFCWLNTIQTGRIDILTTVTQPTQWYGDHLRQLTRKPLSYFIFVWTKLSRDPTKQGHIFKLKPGAEHVTNRDGYQSNNT